MELNRFELINSFSFSGCPSKVKEPSLPYYLPIFGRIVGFIPVSKPLLSVLALSFLCVWNQQTSVAWKLLHVPLQWSNTKNFRNFRSDIMEKQDIINLSSYNSKSCISVFHSDSKVVFLGEGEDAAFCPFLCDLFIDSVALSKTHVIKFYCLQEEFHWDLQLPHF